MQNNHQKIRYERKKFINTFQKNNKQIKLRFLPWLAGNNDTDIETDDESLGPLTFVKMLEESRLRDPKIGNDFLINVYTLARPRPNSLNLEFYTLHEVDQPSGVFIIIESNCNLK